MKLKINWSKLKVVLSRPLTEGQIEGFKTLLAVLNEEECSLKEASYIFATVLFETEGRLEPIIQEEEESYYTDMYDVGGLRTVAAISLGNRDVGDGFKYRPRGLVPIVGKDTYTLFGNSIGINLEEEPEKLDTLEVSCKAVVHGMLNGYYTGLYLPKYINEDKTDYINARRVINGVENAKKISTMATQLEVALEEVTNGED